MSMHENDILYVNGQFVDAADATVSVRDRGFRFGDGVFETIAFFDYVPYQWDVHLDRLYAGLEALSIPTPDIDWKRIAQELFRRNPIIDIGFLRIAVSRGVGSRGYRAMDNMAPTICMEVMDRPDIPTSLSLYLSTYHKTPLSSLPGNNKHANALNSILALQEADAKGCDEALLLTGDEYLCEAASGNLFWIIKDTLFTPALDTGCVNGTTRQAIIRLHKQSVVTVSAPLSALKEADAVFLTNSNWGIVPVSWLKPKGWNWAINHPILQTLQGAFAHDVKSYVLQHQEYWR